MSRAGAQVIRFDDARRRSGRRRELIERDLVKVSEQLIALDRRLRRLLDELTRARTAESSE